MAVTRRHRNLSFSLKRVRGETRKVLAAYTPQRGGGRAMNRGGSFATRTSNGDNDDDDSTVNQQRAVSSFLMRSRGRVASD